MSEILPAGIFALAILLLTAAGVQLAGYFPLAGRPVRLMGRGGLAVILLASLAAAALAVTALLLALAALTWPAAVIAGGLGIVAGPLLFQILPRHQADSTPGVLVTALSLAAATLVLTLWRAELLS